MNRRSEVNVETFVKVSMLALLGVGGALGCSVDVGEDDPLAFEPVASSEQDIITGAKVTQTYKLVTIPAGATLWNATVDCPAKSVPVGGGYNTPSDTRVFSSAPTAKGWAVSIQNLSNGTSSWVNIVTECLSGTAATSAVGTASVLQLEPSKYGCARVSCPSGGILTGGGYLAGTPFRPMVSRAYSDTQWEVCGKNQNPGATTAAYVYPVCLSGVSGAMSRQVFRVSIPSNETKRIDSTPCGSGLLLGSGGYQFVSDFIQALGNHRSFQDSKVWTGTFLSSYPGSTEGSVVTTCLDLW